MLRLLLGFALLTLAPFVQADEYDTLRAKWKDIIIGSGYDTLDPDVASRLTSIANSANTNWNSMIKTTGRTSLWSDLASTTNSAQVTSTYTRLWGMARAYATPGCSLAGNTTLLADIVSGLDWMHANRYGANTVQYDNWWDWEIGSPLRLTDICVMLCDQLTPTQLTNYMNAGDYQTPMPDMTQANKVWKARVVGVRGCLVRSSAKLVLCRDAFSDVFPYVTTGDGFYTDGSFIQHNYHPYTAGYGATLIREMAPVMNWLSGSSWAITDPAQSNLYRWVFDSFEPTIYNGNLFDLVRGREAGWANATPNANSMMDSILRIAQFAPPADALRMKRMLKEWVQKNSANNFVTSRGLPTLELAKSLMNDASIAPRGELLAHYSFAEMDRVIHLGEGYGFGLAMCSTRIANFESINGENLRGWFTGDGQTTLYNGDLNAFADSYWATVDHYRLPGVTADVTASKLPHQTPSSGGPRAQGESTRSPHSWVGGATLGKFGAAGMQFKGVAVTLTGKKSWFMFDDEIVCLGAGITSTDSRPIETTVEQRKINSAGDNALTVNGTAKSTSLGWTETMSDTSWAHLAGNVTGSDIGYYFPTSATLKALREARTGAWSDIDTDGSTSPIMRNYLRMNFEHGSNPTDATYQYVLLPGRNAARTGHYADEPDITVINNDANVQAVRENTLGITAANFWTDNTFTYGGITSNRKASVLVRDDGPFIDVSVSDPTHLNTLGINLQIAFDGGTLVSADSGVTVTQSTPTISMTISTSGSAGKTFKARFYKLAPQTVNLTSVADSHVQDGTSANSNFGTASNLVIKKAGTGFNRETYLRFDVPASGSILLGGTLNLACLTASTPGMHAVAKVDDNSWIESGVDGITWNNKPAAGPVLSTWTPVSPTTSSVDVSNALPVSGLVSFKVYDTTQTSDGFVTYGSKENTTAPNPPQLALIYGNTPPEVSISTPADGAVFSRAGTVTVTADAIATDGVVTSVAFYDGPTLLGTDTTAPYSITPSLGGGPHYLKATATDANGLSRTSFINRVDVAYPPVANGSTVSAPQSASIDIDLQTLVSDVETPLASLKLQPGAATHGTVTLLADGRTARFTPTAGYSGPASFTYTVTDTTRDERTVLNYAFQNSDVTDTSGQGRDATLNVQGTGAATFPTDSPLADYTKSIALTENGTAGAVRVDRSLTTAEVDLANGDWTIAGWFKRNAVTNRDFVMQLGSFGSLGPSALSLVFYDTDNTLQLRNYTSSNTSDITLTKTNVLPGTWNHFTIVRSGSVISWYHNGVIVGSDDDFALAITNSEPVKFGGPGATSVLDRWFNGSLADLAVFDAALAPADITKLYIAPVQWFGGQITSATINVNVLTPYDTWRQTQFGITSNTGIYADNADKDNDGLLNLLEYAFATNPNTPNAAPYSVVHNGSNLEYTYSKNKSATDVTYTVEWSDTLGNDWSTNGVTQSLVPGSDNNVMQQWKATMPAGAEWRRFVRLCITKP